MITKKVYLIKLILIIVTLALKSLKAKTFQEPRYTKGHVIGRKKEIHGEAQIDLELDYDEWIQYHNERNWTKKYPILGVTQKYFKNATDKISRIQLLNLAVDYMVYEMAHHDIKLSFGCIHEMKRLWRHAFHDYFTDNHHHSKFYNITEIYAYFNGLEFIHIFHMKIEFKDLPKEFRHKLREHFSHVRERDFREMFNWLDDPHGHKNDTELKRKRLNDHFYDRYYGVEWKADGRRVTDDDYDDLEPKYERIHHKIRTAKHRLNDDELKELMDEMDL